MTSEINKFKNIELTITVQDNSFLHIGASPSPLSEKKGSVFQIDGVPVIPATSFKGALRNQLELLFIKNNEELKKLLKTEHKLKPCLPTNRPSKAEGTLESKYILKNCSVTSEENVVKLNNSDGICPVCYFTGSGGIMGFLRFDNFYPTIESSIIDHTNIRIDRKTGTAADRALVNTEQVKPGTVFKGKVSILEINSTGDFVFGKARKIESEILDKWLNDTDQSEILIEKILKPALLNINELGGYKSRGAGKIKIDLS